MRDVIVIGKGIFGCTIGSMLRKQGRDVLILDDHNPLAGSPPSGGHMKPSWIGGMSKLEYEESFEMLDGLFGLHEEEFRVRPYKTKTTVFRVDIDKALNVKHTFGRVLEVDLLETNTPQVTYFSGNKGKTVERCKMLVVAAGAWCAELLPEIFTGPRILTAKQGVSFRYKTSRQVGPFIEPWAPYKQIVANHVTPTELWIGDGTAIIPKNWTSQRVSECRIRCAAALKTEDRPVKVLNGLRPYVKAEPCFLRKLGKATWVVTGAGKQGTVAAGWAACQIEKGSG